MDIDFKQEWEKLQKELKEEFPKLQFIDKPLFKGFSTVLCFPGYGWKYFHSKDIEGTIQGCCNIKHERRHLRDMNIITRPLFAFLYLFGLPLLFTFRSIFEYRGYKETMLAYNEYGQPLSDNDIDYMVSKYFVGYSYFFMASPFGWLIKRKLKKVRDNNK